MFRQRELYLDGAKGNKFRIILRHNILNQFDFSIILFFLDDDGTGYCLLRFNGRHPSQHTNKWEKQKGLTPFSFRNRFHIHLATERYQLEGLRIDGYAEVTECYDSFASALTAFVGCNGFEASDAGPDEPLFDTGTTEKLS
jgi:hypothetical protein